MSPDLPRRTASSHWLGTGDASPGHVAGLGAPGSKDRDVQASHKAVLSGMTGRPTVVAAWVRSRVRPQGSFAGASDGSRDGFVIADVTADRLRPGGSRGRWHQTWAG
jgi:hypothetical protein